MPAAPAAGVPDSSPVAPDSEPVDVSNVTPVGNAPLSARVGAGKPAAVTAKLLAAPVVKAACPAELMDGAAFAGGGPAGGVPKVQIVALAPVVVVSTNPAPHR